MEVKFREFKGRLNKVFSKHMIPISLILSIFLSSTIGYTSALLATNNTNAATTSSSSFKKQEETIKDKLKNAEKVSINQIESELANLSNHYQLYRDDLTLMLEQVKWLNDYLVPYRGIIKTLPALSYIKFIGVIPGADEIGDKISLAKRNINEIDETLKSLEALSALNTELNNSIGKIEGLYKEYGRTKDVNILFQIEQELTTNFSYLIKDLGHYSEGSYSAFKISYSILNSIIHIKKFGNLTKDVSQDAMDAVKFWEKESKELESATNIEIDKSAEKNLNEKVNRLKQLPEKLEKQTRDSLNSINTIQKELQTLKVVNIIK